MATNSILLQNLEDLIEAIQIPCVLTDNKGEIIFSNKLFSKTLLSSKTANINEIFNIDFQNQKPNNVISIDENKSLYYIELKNKNKKSYLVFIIKYTDQRKFTSDIKLLNHDLNNILTEILNSALIIKQNLKDEHLRQIANNIENSVNRASSILESFISQELTTSTTNKKIDLIKLINEVINSLSLVNNNKAKITFRRNVEAYINGDYNQIFRAIQNLCINAIESIKTKGNIFIDLTTARKDEVKKLELNKKYIKLRIKDDGCGIKKSDIKKIFDEGFSTKKKGRQSGLGLYGVKNFIEAHKGAINVKSTIHKGTEFSLYLPLIGEIENISFDSDKKIKIIVADDENNILELLKELFLSYNYDVASAKNGDEVLNILDKDSKYDFLVIDRKMPNLDGIECIKRIRRKNHSIKIILTTGSPSIKLDSAMLKNLDIAEVISKPYDFNYLLETVRRIIFNL